jgi:hypothetical protein
MKFLTVVIILFLIHISSYGNNPEKPQNKSNNLLINEEKKAIAVAGINSDLEISNRVISGLNEVNIPATYIQLNLTDYEFFPHNIKQKSVVNSAQSENELQNWLNTNKAGQDILSKWFNRQPDGSFSTSFLVKNEIINNDLADKISNPESNKKEIAEELASSALNNTYLLVFDFSNIQTMDDYYIGRNTSKKNRILRGYIANVKTYIFKFDYNRSVAQTFLTNYFTENDDEAAQTKQEKFDDSEFPFFLVTVHEEEIASVQPRATQKRLPSEIKSNEDLLDVMAQLAVGNITDHLKKGTISISVKKAVSTKKPITAKIGAAQKVKFDQRFGVYENRITPTGKIKAKQISVVKSMKVANNVKKNRVPNDYSAFYKIASGKVRENDMFLRKKFDTGINLFAGKTTNGISGITGRFEYYFSKALGGAIMPGQKAKGLTSVKLYFEAAQDEKTYRYLNNPEYFTFTRGSIGIEKEYRPVGFIHLGPFIGYGLEYTTWDKSDFLFSTNFAETGARLGINLRHNIQVVGSATYYLLIKTVLMDNNRDVINPDFDYLSTFYDRTEWGYSIGLRIML